MATSALERAVLDGCHVYGVSAWNLKLAGVSQKNLVVSKKNEPLATVGQKTVLISRQVLT